MAEHMNTFQGLINQTISLENIGSFETSNMLQSLLPSVGEMLKNAIICRENVQCMHTYFMKT